MQNEKKPFRKFKKALSAGYGLEPATKTDGGSFRLESLEPTPKNLTVQPPKEWFDKKYKEVKDGNPTYADEQVRTTVGKVWSELMSKKQKKEHREAEGKVYGKPQEVKKSLFSFTPLNKSHYRYEANSMQNENNMIPAVVCDYHDKDGKFMEMRVVTVKDVLKAPANFDCNVFSFLIRSLSKRFFDGYDYDCMIKCAEVIADLAKELAKRATEEKKEREAQKTESPDKGNWELKKDYYMGKSIMFFTPEEFGIKELYL